MKALLRLAESTSHRIELVVLSPASADASPRLFASLHEHGLHATRAAFTGGEAFGAYLQAFGVDLLSSADNGEVSQAVASGTLAALVTTSLVDAAPSDRSDSPRLRRRCLRSRKVRRADQGAEGTWPTSVEKPLASLTKLLSELQTREPGARHVRTALISRSASPAEQPVLKALREANVRLDEAYFGTGLPHKELLEVFRRPPARSPAPKAPISVSPKRSRRPTSMRWRKKPGPPRRPGPASGRARRIGTRRRPPTIHPRRESENAAPKGRPGDYSPRYR